MTGEILCIVPGPTIEIARRGAGTRWCFACRKHLPHIDVLMGDAEPSYYDPTWIRECSRCGQDRTAFPGREWAEL